jgi:hypothetical protein
MQSSFEKVKQKLLEVGMGFTCLKIIKNFF